MFPKYYPQLKEAFINTVNVDLIGTKGSGTETYRPLLKNVVNQLNGVLRVTGKI